MDLSWGLSWGLCGFKLGFVRVEGIPLLRGLSVLLPRLFSRCLLRFFPLFKWFIVKVSGGAPEGHGAAACPQPNPSTTNPEILTPKF